MNCIEVLGHLPAYADGELPGGLRDQVRSHIAACAACRRRLGEFDRLWDLMDNLESVNPPADFSARVRERVEEGLMPARVRSLRKVWAVGAAAAAVLAAFGMFAALTGPAGPPDAAPAPTIDQAAADARDERALLDEMTGYPELLDLLEGLDAAGEGDVDLDVLDRMELLSGAGSAPADEFGIEETAIIPDEADLDWMD